MTAGSPYGLPQTLTPGLARIKDLWDDRKRGDADMPFSDDFDFAKLQALSGGIFLLSAFEDPQRFRFEWVGQTVSERYGGPLAGVFSDEVEARPPLENVAAQAKATVAQRSPTFFQGTGGRGGYARILLPTWGDGHVAMLLGAVDEQDRGSP